MDSTFRSARLARGLTQDQAAAAIGSGRAHVARIESGRTDPRLSTVRRLARAYGLADLERALEGLTARTAS